MDVEQVRLRRWMARVLKEAQEAEGATGPVWARQHRPDRAAKARDVGEDGDRTDA